MQLPFLFKYSRPLHFISSGQNLAAASITDQHEFTMIPLLTVTLIKYTMNLIRKDVALFLPSTQCWFRMFFKHIHYVKMFFHNLSRNTFLWKHTSADWVRVRAATKLLPRKCQQELSTSGRKAIPALKGELELAGTRLCPWSSAWKARSLAVAPTALLRPGAGSQGLTSATPSWVQSGFTPLHTLPFHSRSSASAPPHVRIARLINLLY